MGNFAVLSKSLDFVSDFSGINFGEISPFVKFSHGGIRTRFDEFSGFGVFRIVLIWHLKFIGGHIKSW